jgi:hypothetical protein
MKQGHLLVVFRAFFMTLTLLVPGAFLMPAEIEPVQFTPPLPRGDRWKLDVHGESRWARGDFCQRQKIELSMILSRDSNNDILYTDVTGPQEVYRCRGNLEVPTEKQENLEGKITANPDAAGVLHDARDRGRLSNDILLIFPPGPAWGIIVPPGTVQLGHRWSSGKVVPLGSHMFRKKKFSFSHVMGWFTLEKIEGKRAYITWTGQGQVTSGRVSWYRHIVYHLDQGMFASSTGSLTMMLDNGMVIRYHLAMTAVKIKGGAGKKKNQ